MNAFEHFGINDWLFFLETRHLEEIQLGLERVRVVAARLGLLNTTATVITVAGTNGKGSTVSALEAIYRAQGYQVGAYTSPHLLKFNERIRVNQNLISDEQLCRAFEVVEACRGDVHLTYFEATTLAALWHFKTFSLDVLLLEVGMGGRLDATNILDPSLAIITTVDLDHQAYLGDTREEIAAEKAGIFRADIPLIYADDQPPHRIRTAAKALSTPLYQLNCDYFFQETNGMLQINLPTQSLTLTLPKLNPKAVSAAVFAVALLNNLLPVDMDKINDALSAVSLPGRQQKTESNGVFTLFDVAHNPQAVRLLANLLEKKEEKGTVHAVFSALKDKDIVGLVQPLVPYVHRWYPAVLNGKRAASEVQLLACLEETGVFCRNSCYDDPTRAYQAALEEALPGDWIVVYGSFLTVEAILSAQAAQYNRGEAA